MIDAKWLFEPCENEGPICDPTGEPWPHAVRGRKPARPMVMGYGNTPSTADEDARRKAQEQDAREVLGQRGEVVTKYFAYSMPIGWEIVDPDGMIITAKLGGEIVQCWKVKIQPIGT